MRRRTELDGLRGVAIALVVLYHWRLPLLARGGWVGVEVFFVLSGYLITGLLLREHQRRDRISLRNFWSRRVLRLLPALLLFTIVMTIVGGWTMPRSSFTPLPAFAAVMLYATNWVRAFSLHGIHMGPLDHTWSLSLEEQFYLIWPLVLIPLARTGRRRTWLVTGGLGVAGVAARLLAPIFVAEPSVLYYSSFTRAAGLLLGAAMAAAQLDGRLKPGRWMEAAAALCLAGILVAAVTMHSGSSLALGWGLTLVDLATVTILVALTTGGAPRLVRWLSWRPLVGLGTVSYSLYLWHEGLYTVLLSHHGKTPERYGLLVLATVATVAASWLLTEKPFLARRRRLAEQAEAPLVVLVDEAAIGSELDELSSRAHHPTGEAWVPTDRPSVPAASGAGDHEAAPTLTD